MGGTAVRGGIVQKMQKITLCVQKITPGVQKITQGVQRLQTKRVMSCKKQCCSYTSMIHGYKDPNFEAFFSYFTYDTRMSLNYRVEKCANLFFLGRAYFVAKHGTCKNCVTVLRVNRALSSAFSHGMT